MKWIKDNNSLKIPIKSWCSNVEVEALVQASNLANHPVVEKHVALMPDCHVGYGMPIGGVIACSEAVIPNAVGVDIGCGMAAIQTDLNDNALSDRSIIREILEKIKSRVPVGEGNANNKQQSWSGFSMYLQSLDIESDEIDYNDKKLPGWFNPNVWTLASKNLGTLGGGNHFIEMQKDKEGTLWLMLHSGSRNLGYQIASYYHKLAKQLNFNERIDLPDVNLAYLPTDSGEGLNYIRDMKFALGYALENRQRMMNIFKEAIFSFDSKVEFVKEINIHHNYAAIESHDGKDYWIHRKGATSAKDGELGIIPGSMGTCSYIVEGLGSDESFSSCSHGAGRKMGRMEACRILSVKQCDEVMNGVVFDRWKKLSKWGRKKRKEKLWDLGESPLAYKDINDVIDAQLDLINPLVKLEPIGVVKG